MQVAGVLRQVGAEFCMSLRADRAHAEEVSGPFAILKTCAFIFGSFGLEAFQFVAWRERSRGEQ